MSMNCLGFEPGNIHLYVALCGLFIGAAASRLVRGPVSGAGRKSGGISSLVPLYLSAAILSALAAVFLGGGYPGPGVFIPLGVTAGGAFLSGLFRRAAGIPLGILCASLLVFLGFSLSPWVCGPVNGEFLRIQRLSSGGQDMTMEIEISGKSPELYDIQDTKILLRFYTLKADPAWFFVRDVVFFIFSLTGEDPDGAPSLKPGHSLSRFPGWTLTGYTAEPCVPEQFGSCVLQRHDEEGFTFQMNGSAIPLVLTRDGGKN